MKNLFIFLLGLVFAISAEAQTVIKQRMQYTSVTPTVSNAVAYTAKDAVGGLMTFAAVCNTSANISVNSVMITDKDDQASAYDLQLFSANPTNSTFTNNDPVAVNAGDLAKLLPVISLNATDHFSYNSNGISSLSSLDSGGFVTTTGGALRGLLVARGTVLPTYTSTTAIVVTIGYTCQ